MSSQHAVIVGGSSGVGLATAGTLLARGLRVTITGRDAQKLEKAKASLRGDIYALAMDAADNWNCLAFFNCANVSSSAGKTRCIA